jgi:membrane protease YdiL (CAAX protease family)
MEHTPELEVMTEPVPTERRNYAGWVFLWLIFGFLIVRGLAGTLAEETKAAKQFNTEQLTLRQAVLVKRLAGLAPGMGSLSETFDQVQDQIKEDANQIPEAARIYLAAQQENGERPAGQPLSVLLRSKDPQDQELGRMYAAERLTRSEADRFLARVTDSEFAKQLARVQAREKAGLSPTGRDELVPAWKAIGMMIAVLALTAVCGLGLVVWVLFFALRGNGQIRALGFPMGAISAATADRLAIRAAQIFGMFLLLGTFAAMLQRQGMPSAMASLIPSLGVLSFVFLVQGLPIGDKKITLADIGISRIRFGKHVTWGVAGYFAELPLTLLMGFVGQRIFSFLPPPEHPASTMLQKRPDLWVVVSVLVFGAVIAPFWEEIVFRGLMFPATAKTTWGPVAGALITSLIFAAIHPQGLSTWLALGSVAGVSCVLAYHTKSLVPCITMHALHNLSLLVGTILIF